MTILKIRVSVVRFRPWPPLSKPNPSRLGFFTSGLPHTARGLRRFCVCRRPYRAGQKAPTDPPHPGLFDFDAVESAVTAIYNKMQDARVSPDVSSLLQDLYDVVDVAVATDTPSVREPTARYDLSNIDFSRLRAEFEKSPFKNVVAMNLMEKIEERLAAMVARNPTRVDLYERYQEILQEYNKDKDAAEIQKVMDDLFAFNDDCSEEEKRYLREGLDSETELASVRSPPSR